MPYGLPCIALTRRTIETSVKLAHIERVNEKICRIIRSPGDFIDINYKNNDGSNNSSNHNSTL